MTLLHNLILSKIFGGSGGGSVTVDTELSATSTNPVQNKAIASAFGVAWLALDGKEDAVVLNTFTETAVTFSATYGHFYDCTNTLTSLTVTSSPGTGGWSVRFTSGSTATVLTMPNTVVMPDGFEVEANTVYEINVLDGYALVASWPVASS